MTEQKPKAVSDKKVLWLFRAPFACSGIIFYKEKNAWIPRERIKVIVNRCFHTKRSPVISFVRNACGSEKAHMKALIVKTTSSS